MITLLRHYVVAFFFDENAAKRFLAGLAGFLGSAVFGVLVFGFKEVSNWDRHTLLQHAVFALLTTFTTMLPGPKIAKPPTGLVELEPPRGYTALNVVLAVACGVVAFLLAGLLLHLVGLNARGYMLAVLIATAAAAYGGWKLANKIGRRLWRP